MECGVRRRGIGRHAQKVLQVARGLTAVEWRPLRLRPDLLLILRIRGHDPTLRLGPADRYWPEVQEVMVPGVIDRSAQMPQPGAIPSGTRRTVAHVAAMTMCPRCGSTFLQPLRCEAK